MAESGPTVPGRRLGKELKRLRAAIGKTQAEVGEYVGTPATTISKIENAQRNAPLPHLKLMLQLYGVSPAHAEYLHQLAQQAKERGWWADYGEIVPKWFTEYVSLESAAGAVWTYEQEAVPGLLQTETYAKAMTDAVHSESAEEFARVRATRQQRLTDNNPMVLRAVLSETVLHRHVGGPEVMREQLARLRDAITQPNITVQILPFAVGPHPGMAGPFAMLRFAERLMNLVYVELRGGSVYLERPEDLDLHEATFEHLSDLALSGADTALLLTEMERRY